ncbi:unnamed protein product [Periconia digitata]|uniref:Uncharacterized protein n=1 Tax=Periconia digitata TaxID=1303443 RepID=A0A9W4XX44_9PLEO|nr:unnamed protein product [Periconia digitata]
MSDNNQTNAETTSINTQTPGTREDPILIDDDHEIGSFSMPGAPTTSLVKEEPVSIKAEPLSIAHNFGITEVPGTAETQDNGDIEEGSQNNKNTGLISDSKITEEGPTPAKGDSDPRDRRPKATRKINKKSQTIRTSARKPAKRVIQDIHTWGDPEQSEEALSELNSIWRDVRITCIQLELFSSRCLAVEHPLCVPMTQFKNIIQRILQETGASEIDPRSAFVLQKHWEVVKNSVELAEVSLGDDLSNIESFGRSLQHLVDRASYYEAIFKHPQSQRAKKRRKIKGNN